MVCHQEPKLFSKKEERGGRGGFLSRLVINSLMILWLCGLTMITLSPVAHLGQRRPVELVPLRETFVLVTDSVSWQVPVAQIGGNIALFLPIGALLIFRLGWGLTRTTIVGTSVAVLIELGQYISGSGRVASMDDVGMAALGTSLGALACRLVFTFGPGPVRVHRCDELQAVD